MSDNWGNVTAWSAGVSAVAATFLGVIVTLVKKPLHSPMFIACLVIACLAFALLLWAGPAWVMSKRRSRRPREQAESPQPTTLGPAITDRWRPATNGMTSTLTQLQYNSMSHPAYMRRDPLKRPPPSLRLGIVMTSSELDRETPETAEVRARFLNFLNQPEIMDLVRELAQVGSLSWQAWNENPRFNFGAVLTSGGEDAVPVAWARLLLPESLAPRYGHDAERTSFVLYIELGGVGEAPPSPRRLVQWQQSFAQTLKLPAALAAFLTDGLGIRTVSNPSAEVAMWLEASEKLTELVDIDGMSVVPGSPQLSGFTGYAMAEADGQDIERLALSWLRTMCDSVLHLRDSATLLATLARTGDGPPLRVEVKEPEWQYWRGLVYIVAIRVVITNQTDIRIQLGGVDIGCDWEGAAGTISPINSDARVILERDKDALQHHRYSPSLIHHSFIEPGEQVSGWVVTDVPWIGPNMGTPALTVTVRDAVGSAYLNVIPRKEAQRFGP